MARAALRDEMSCACGEHELSALRQDAAGAEQQSQVPIGTLTKARSEEESPQAQVDKLGGEVVRLNATNALLSADHDCNAAEVFRCGLGGVMGRAFVRAG